MTPSAERYKTNSWNKKSIRNPTKLNPHGKEFTQKKRWIKDNPFVISFLKLMHVIQKIVGRQLLILVACKVYLQHKGPIETHSFKLQQKFLHLSKTRAPKTSGTNALTSREEYYLHVRWPLAPQGWRSQPVALLHPTAPIGSWTDSVSIT